MKSLAAQDEWFLIVFAFNSRSLFLGRIAVLRAYMRPIVTDGVAWSVCRSVCHDREPCRNCWTDRDAVWVMDSGWPTEACIRWVQIPQREGAIFRGKLAAHCKVYGLSAVSCAKTAEPIEIPFGMWTPVGPRKHD